MRVSDLFIFAAALVVSGMVLMLVVGYMNRYMKRIGEHAAEIIKGRFTRRDRIPVENILDGAGIPFTLRPRARHLVKRLAAAIEVSPELLRLKDTLADLVVVRKDELGEDDLKAWDKAGLDKRFGGVLYIFADEVFKVLMKTFKKTEWKVLWGDIPHNELPSGEASLLELIIDMRIQDLIDVFDKSGDAHRY